MLHSHSRVKAIVAAASHGYNQPCPKGDYRLDATLSDSTQGICSASITVSISLKIFFGLVIDAP